MNQSEAELDQLLALTRSRTVGAACVRRARLILMLEGGESRDAIMSKLGCDSRFIARWSSKFLAERLAGMYARHPGSAPKQPPAKLEARILNHTLKRKPADGSTYWSSYKLAGFPCRRTRMYRSTTRPPTRPGSIRWRAGSAVFSAT